jgi:branched-subunit amino acid transport protein
MNAQFLRLNVQDLLRGLIVAVATAILMPVVLILQQGHLPTTTDMRTAALAALAAGISYLVKNLLTNSNDQMFKTEKKVG